MQPDKIALLDCDQVLCRTWEPIVEQVAPRLIGQPLTSFHLFDMMTEEEGVEARKLMKSGAWWRARQPIEGSQEGLEMLRRNGFERTVITAPWQSCKNWGYERRNWLKKHYGLTRDNVVITHRKEFYWGDIFFEDRAKNLLAWSKRFPRSCPVIVDAGWNQDVTPDQAVRMHSWADLPQVLEAYDKWTSTADRGHLSH